MAFVVAGRGNVHGSAPERFVGLHELSKLLQQQQVREREMQHLESQAQ